jgi:putative transposase
LTKRVLESALEGEITDHVGYDKHDSVGKGSGNSRNGTRAKAVLTDVGPVEVRVPRDVAGTCEPQIVCERQRRLCGVDDLVLSLSAEGLTHGEISAHLAEVYGTEVSKQTISTITDKVVRARGHFPNEQAALKCVYLTLMSLDPNGAGRRRWTMRWKAPLNAFQIAFEGRLIPTNH